MSSSILVNSLQLFKIIVGLIHKISKSFKILEIIFLLDKRIFLFKLLFCFISTLLSEDFKLDDSYDLKIE